MTTPYVAQDIGHDEGGFRSEAYPDPDTGAAPWTVGFGETGPSIGPDTTMTLDQATNFLNAQVQQIEHQLDLAIPWWRQMNDARQDVFVNMAYNLGVHGLLEWPLFLNACKAGDWNLAEVDMIGTPGKPDKWERQVKTRGTRLAKQLVSGVRVAP